MSLATARGMGKMTIIQSRVAKKKKFHYYFNAASAWLPRRVNVIKPLI